jgi:hypothetical protein
MIIGLVLAVGSWFLLKTPDDVVDQIFGWFGLVFFSFCVIIAIKRMIASGTPFVFDRAGISFPTGSFGLLPWTEIKSYSIVKMRGNQFLSLTFNDPDRVLSRVSAAKRKWALVNKGLGFGHWSLSFAGLSPGLDEAVAFISQHVSSSV